MSDTAGPRDAHLEMLTEIRDLLIEIRDRALETRDAAVHLADEAAESKRFQHQAAVPPKQPGQS